MVWGAVQHACVCNGDGAGRVGVFPSSLKHAGARVGRFSSIPGFADEVAEMGWV